MTRYATLKEDTEFYDWYTNLDNDMYVILAGTIVEVELHRLVCFLSCGKLIACIERHNSDTLLDFLE